MFLLILTAGDMSRMGYLFHYMANFDFYKNELCENKQNKKLKCNGLCHLSKEMANTKIDNNNPSQERNNTILELKEPLNFLIEDIKTSSDPNPILAIELQNYKMPHWAYLSMDEIFHPPCI